MSTILVVEDNTADFVLLRHAFQMASVEAELVLVRDGREAIDFIESSLSSGESPGYVILDLGLPRLDGLELLAWLRLRLPADSMRVMVLTSSTLQSDRARSKQFGVDVYREKPDTLLEYVQMARELARRWSLVTKPRALSAGEKDEREERDELPNA